MELIKKYKVSIMIVVPVLILVLFRSFGSNHFQSDSKKWAEPSVMRSNIVTSEKLSSLKGEVLLINLDGVKSSGNLFTGKSLNITPDSVLDRNNVKVIHQHNGPVVLSSFEPAVSARIWMLLSQMGIKNLYILSNSTDNEVFKNKFRPDTLVRPEL